MKEISSYLLEDLILFPSGNTREEVIAEMVEAVDKSLKLPDKQAFHKALLEREKIVSTGIGMGVAIPHAKMSDYEHFFVAIGILRKGVDWHSLDDSPVKMVFMIGGPDDKQTEYLQLLSSLTLAIKSDLARKKLLTERSPSGIIQIFRGINTYGSQS